MFTGIIEALGTVKKVEKDRSNIHFTIESPISDELKIDQSISHNGACLTVVEVSDGAHRVTAVEETLRRTNLGQWHEGSLVNLERCMLLNGRLDGHIVQGHVDALATCVSVEDENGSWRFTFAFPTNYAHLLVDKGSVCINGISLTVISPTRDQFSVAIIPYTWQHTNLHQINPGDTVNIEFDIIGKYTARMNVLMC